MGSLDDYRDKRDFTRTPEPGAERAPAPAERAPVFVVHRHEARNLHYDLRLESLGVLCSWAVPKGFSYAPADKRLAVRTEDHPLAYEHFHGRIPKGEYGAGTMTIWDHGTYEIVKAADLAAAVRDGEVKVRLRGRRLRGEWHLVKTNQGKNTWLLFKSKDAWSGPSRDSALGVGLERTEARPLPAPDAVEGMRAGGERAAFVDADWVFEAELPGRRARLRRDGDRVTIDGLAGVPPAIARDAQRLPCERALLDGVLVAQGDGVPDPAAAADSAALDRALRAGGDGVVFYAFDLLHWEDYDLRPLPLLDRKAALRATLPPLPSVLFVDHVAGSGPLLLEAIAAAGLPAAIAKRADSAYAAGPSPDWLRIPVGGGDGDHTGAPAPARRERAAPRPAVAAPAGRVRLTNLDKVYWPAEGHTKGDLIAYYEQVADALLPHLKDRPVHLNRYPDGIDGKSFYQREAKPGTPDWVRTAPIPHDGEVVPHHVIDDRDMLRYVIQLGSIDLHPWLSRVQHPDEPDYAVLDLDPKTAPFAWVVRIARVAGRLLRGIGLRPLLKTSGKNGMHVFVPLQRGYSYDHARMFTEGVARVLQRELPDIATTERVPAERRGRVYLDFLQNRRSQTIVPPYSARPVRGASVSAPLSWDELEDDDLSPLRFTLQTMPARLQERGDLFRRALDDPQDLLPAIEALQQVLRE
ncbi:MAG: non-homologous end-joining DNA ligase [Planctomycetota bacterium]